MNQASHEMRSCRDYQIVLAVCTAVASSTQTVEEAGDRSEQAVFALLEHLDAMYIVLQGERVTSRTSFSLFIFVLELHVSLQLCCLSLWILQPL